MDDLVHHVGAFIEANRMLAGPILAVIAFGESMAFIGLFFPATALMLLTGGLIGAGKLDMAPVMIWTMVGAILGDAVSYYIGRWIGPSMWKRWPLNRDRDTVIRARVFFRRYGMLSIFLGRFLGPIRAIIPLVAGIMLMDHRKFQIANVLSAIVWVPVMLAPGYIAANSLVDLSSISEGEWMALVAFALVATIAGSWGAVKLVKWQSKRHKGRARLKTRPS